MSAIGRAAAPVFRSSPRPRKHGFKQISRLPVSIRQQPFRRESMARKKPSANTGYVLFDVLYEDGSRSSNRKVPAEDLGGLDGDEPARSFLEEQETKIGQASGRPRAKIKSIVRSGKR
jgi:hypothetical protein